MYPMEAALSTNVVVRRTDSSEGFGLVGEYESADTYKCGLTLKDC